MKRYLVKPGEKIDLNKRSPNDKGYFRGDKEEGRLKLAELNSRLDTPHKLWKFRRGDLEDRKLWDDYMKAYADTLSKTSTESAPWYIIPSNRKWYRNLVISRILVDTLEGLNMSFPEPEENLDNVVIE